MKTSTIALCVCGFCWGFIILTCFLYGGFGIQWWESIENNASRQITLMFFYVILVLVGGGSYLWWYDHRNSR